ncbi:hypothetical protein Tsubulata_050156 [Turnera subulata]|uniref:C2 NT-type domain-containing protein n=1 Tax=Turnera subulata TaxID=218843 RepID=A0A9Q0F8H1_9ROSI|nr:hypothetical protein Tsubulata_050156 [Turnera subulata]
MMHDGGNGNSDSGQLLQDIEAISKALYLHKTPQRALITTSSARSKSVERPRLSEPKSNPSPNVLKSSVPHKDKKSSLISNWKNPLKALAHFGHQKFNICFFLHVHSIEGLPSEFNDSSLSVHWKRKDEVLRSRPSSVSKGIAEFDETLMHQCCVYGSKTGPHHSAKYEVKLFLIYISVVGAPGTNLGKHWVDLTRLLPLTLEELEGERCTGKWTTSFRLAGKAKGATLNVSFGFSHVRGNLVGPRNNINASELVRLGSNRSLADARSSFGPTSNRILRRVGSVPSDLNLRSPRSSQSLDLKTYGDISPNLGSELCKSIDFLYQKLNEANLHSFEELDTSGEGRQSANCSLEFESGDDHDIDFTVIEQGIEMPVEESLKSKQADGQTTDGSEIEMINVDDIIKEDDIALDDEAKFYSEDSILDSYSDEASVKDYRNEDTTICRNESTMKDLESALESWLISESTKLESPLNVSEFMESPLNVREFIRQEDYVESRSNYNASKMVKRSRSLDEITESVASDFLNMLGVEHSPFNLSSESDPDSPRERLLREFEKEALASGSFIIDYDGNGEDKEHGPGVSSETGCGDLSQDFHFSLATPAAEEEQQGRSALLGRRNAKALEDLETEALMRAWGMNEKAFQSSPRNYADGFGSPIDLPPEECYEQLPPLGDGFGPFIQTKDGGFLRSMCPSLFRNSKNVGGLIMQVSQPVVLPAEMGSDIMDVLQHLASLGIEKLSLEANKLMPLEDITGKTLRQIVKDDAASRTADADREASLYHESMFGPDLLHRRHVVEGFSSDEVFNKSNASLISVEMEGDCATLEEIAPLAMKKIEAMSIEGLRIQSGMSEEAAPSSINSQPTGNDAAGLFGLSITLEDWLRLDAGIITSEDESTDRTLNILSAHHAKCIDVVDGKLEREMYWDKVSDSKHGSLGNNLTLALMVLLRDPLRNYEPVGASMLALIQVERAMFHRKINLHSSLEERSGNREGDQEMIPVVERNDSKNNGPAWFKISEVHLSGFNAEPGKMHSWATKAQQQSGNRWLLASGLSKPCKYPVSKSKAIVVSRPLLTKRLQTADILWSISSQAEGIETNWNDAGFVTHVRNPDIPFPR